MGKTVGLVCFCVQNTQSGEQNVCKDMQKMWQSLKNLSRACFAGWKIPKTKCLHSRVWVAFLEEGHDLFDQKKTCCFRVSQHGSFWPYLFLVFFVTMASHRGCPMGLNERLLEP